MSHIEPHADRSRPKDAAKSAASLSDRIRRLQRQAEALAAAEIMAFQETLGTAIRQAEEIAAGGDAFPVGVREQARRLAESLRAECKTLQALSERKYGPLPAAGGEGPTPR